MEFKNTRHRTIDCIRLFFRILDRTCVEILISNCFQVQNGRKTHHGNFLEFDSKNVSPSNVPICSHVSPIHGHEILAFES